MRFSNVASPFVISGTATATKTDGSGTVQRYDAFYCYQGCGNTPLKSIAVQRRDQGSILDPHAMMNLVAFT